MKASAEEINYLCDSVSEYLAKPVQPEDVVWTYSGVRPLYDDGASEAKAATRDYVFELDTPGGAPLLSIYGGKITTYRRLAEEALERLSPYLRSAKARAGLDREIAAARRRSWTSRRSRRWRRNCSAIIRSSSRRMPTGWRMPTAPAPPRMLGSAKSIGDLGQSFGATLTESEVRYLMAAEWAVHRRRHRLAAIQARIAAVGRRDRRDRRLDCRPSYPA